MSDLKIIVFNPLAGKTGVNLDLILQDGVRIDALTLALWGVSNPVGTPCLVDPELLLRDTYPATKPTPISTSLLLLVGANIEPVTLRTWEPSIPIITSDITGQIAGNQAIQGETLSGGISILGQVVDNQTAQLTMIEAALSVLGQVVDNQTAQESVISGETSILGQVVNSQTSQTSGMVGNVNTLVYQSPEGFGSLSFWQLQHEIKKQTHILADDEIIISIISTFVVMEDDECHLSIAA